MLIGCCFFLVLLGYSLSCGGSYLMDRFGSHVSVRPLELEGLVARRLQFDSYRAAYFARRTRSASHGLTLRTYDSTTRILIQYSVLGTP